MKAFFVNKRDDNHKYSPRLPSDISNKIYILFCLTIVLGIRN